MNLPNLLTVLRVIMTFVAVVLLCADIRFFALASFVIYCAAGATDWFDGYIARKCNIVTTFGKFMDALSDKIMVVSMFMTLFAFNLYSWFTIPALFCAIISTAPDKLQKNSIAHDADKALLNIPPHIVFIMIKKAHKSSVVN